MILRRILVLLLITLTAARAEESAVSDLPAKGLVPDHRILHIGVVVDDMEAALEHWTRFLGLDEKPGTITATGHHANPTTYRGERSDAQVELAFINLDNIQIELLRPIGDEPNHWQEFLDTRGPGVHHIAFEVKGIGEAYVDAYASAGLPVIMSGGWDGGEYIYADTHDALGATVELLERYTPPAAEKATP